MTARVLVVDDIPANVKLLEARLSAEYFDVVTAMSGAGGAGDLRTRRMRSRPARRDDARHGRLRGLPAAEDQSATHHIPVVMVTALDQPSDRVRGLEAGADDFLTKPIPELALIARVRSLTRLKMVTDELRMRALTSRDIGIESPEREAVADTGRGGRILIVDDRPASYERIASDAVEGAQRRNRDRSKRSVVPRLRWQLRTDYHFVGAGEFRCAAAMQPATLARPHPQCSHSRDHRAR